MFSELPGMFTGADVPCKIPVIPCTSSTLKLVFFSKPIRKKPDGVRCSALNCSDRYFWAFSQIINNTEDYRYRKVVLYILPEMEFDN